MAAYLAGYLGRLHGWFDGWWVVGGWGGRSGGDSGLVGGGGASVCCLAGVEWLWSGLRGGEWLDGMINECLMSSVVCGLW